MMLNNLLIMDFGNLDLAVEIIEGFSGSQPVKPPCENKLNPHLKICRKIMKIGTLNVKTMYLAGKGLNDIQEVAIFGISLMEVGEMQSPGAGDDTTYNRIVYFSANYVWIVVQKYVTILIPVAEIILVIQINSTRVSLLIKYTPHY